MTNVAFISLNLGMPNSLNGIQVDSSHAVTLWQIHFNCLHVGPASRPDVRAEARTHMRHGLSSSHVGTPFRASMSRRDIFSKYLLHPNLNKSGAAEPRVEHAFCGQPWHVTQK